MVKINFHLVKKINLPPWKKSISKVLKMNFHGDKNQFSSPVTPANFCADYACTGNTPIWLADIRGKTCHRTSFTANASQSNESVTSAHARGHRTSSCVTWARLASQPVCGCYKGRKLIFIVVDIGSYHRGNWFLPPWKLIFTTVENSFLPLWNFWNFYFGWAPVPAFDVLASQDDHMLCM